MNRTVQRFRNLCLILLTTVFTYAVEGFDIPAHYNKYEFRIPMRDGVRLFTTVYAPKNRQGTYPILMTRTPYSVRPYGPEAYRSILGPHEGFAEEFYIFVYQDVRGRYLSEGDFVDVRPYVPDKTGPREVDENSDTFDTIEWLLENIPGNNGRVGIYGTSYPGFYTAMAIIDSHPAIQAASPQAPIGDWFIGDDWHHHGAFLLQDAFTFYSVIGQPRPAPTTRRPPSFDFLSEDAYRFFLDMGPLPNANIKYFKGQIAFWNELMKHGTYDEFWQERNILPHLKKVKTPVLTVAGWFDAEDPYGPIKIYQEIEKENPGIRNSLVVGPWVHGGWSRMDGDELGNIRFHVRTGEDFRKTVSLPFFQHHLKGEGSLDLPEALIFITGLNAWQRFDAWPPVKTESQKIFFRSEGGLSFVDPGTPEAGFDEYLSDPARPVPYTSQIQMRRPNQYMVEDQRFAARRPDVLVYQTDVLQEDVTLVGPVTPHLWVSSTGTDADFVVKLIDVFPDDTPEREEKYLPVPMAGYQMMVRADVMRAKFRNSYERPEPLAPGQVTLVEFDLPDVAHTFKAGHRIMVQVQSSWFPLIDRNPQKFVDIYNATEDDFQTAVQRLHRSAEHPSHLRVGVIEQR